MSDYLNAKTENVQKFLDKHLEKQKQELISDFLTFLRGLSEGPNYYQIESEIKRLEDILTDA